MTYFDGLNTNEHERSIGTGSNEPLAVGFYDLVITRNVMKQNSEKAKDPQGKYIEVEFDVQNTNNRKYWEKFNIINKSQDAVRIGKEHFADLLKAVGITSLPAGELDEGDPIPDLNGRSVCGYLVIEKGSNGFADSNKCQKYLPSGSTEADYQAWYASKKGSAPAKGAVPEKKTWGAAAPAAEAAPVATQAIAMPSWKKKS